MAGGGLEGRILSLKLEGTQDPVVNTAIFAQNASGLQTTAYLYGRWNCLLPPLLLPQPACCSVPTDILCYSTPESHGWLGAALGKDSHLGSPGYNAASFSTWQ